MQMNTTFSSDLNHMMEATKIEDTDAITPIRRGTATPESVHTSSPAFEKMPTPLHLRLASARFVHTTSADTILVDTMSGLGIASDTAFPSATFTEPLSTTPIEPSSTPRRERHNQRSV